MPNSLGITSSPYTNIPTPGGAGAARGLGASQATGGTTLQMPQYGQQLPQFMQTAPQGSAPTYNNMASQQMQHPAATGVAGYSPQQSFGRTGTFGSQPQQTGPLGGGANYWGSNRYGQGQQAQSQQVPTLQQLQQNIQRAVSSQHALGSGPMQSQYGQPFNFGGQSQLRTDLRNGINPQTGTLFGQFAGNAMAQRGGMGIQQGVNNGVGGFRNSEGTFIPHPGAIGLGGH